MPLRDIANEKINIPQGNPAQEEHRNSSKIDVK